MSKKGSTICGLMKHICRSCLRQTGNMRLKVALLLLVLNFPFGYGGVALFTLIYKRTGDMRWLWGGIICYALSWVMLSVGSVLAGTKAKLFSQITKGAWRAWKRTRAAAFCIVMAVFIAGCIGVQPPERLLAYMYPSLMPMSELNACHKRNIDAAGVKSLLKNAGLEEILSTYGFYESDYSVLARGLSSRGYCEIDGRNCKKSPLRWLYIAFGQNNTHVVMRLDDAWKGSIAAKEGNMLTGSRGELILKMPLPEENRK